MWSPIGGRVEATTIGRGRAPPVSRPLRRDHIVLTATPGHRSRSHPSHVPWPKPRKAVDATSLVIRSDVAVSPVIHRHDPATRRPREGTAIAPVDDAHTGQPPARVP